MERKRDISLDFLRITACILVFGVHLGRQVTIPGILGAFFERGSVGVGFFFVLSGYLSNISLEREFAGHRPGNAILTFWIKRALRILPLYYLVLVFYVIFCTMNNLVPNDPSGLYWIRYFFFLNLWVPSTVEFWFNLGGLWSISVFVFFYLIAPLYYFVIKNYVISWAGVITSFVLFKVLDVRFPGYFPPKYLFYFFLGIHVYQVYKCGRDFMLLSVLTIILFFCILTGTGEALIPPIIAALYLSATRHALPKIKNGMISKMIILFSDLSYGIYLLHPAVLAVLQYLLTDRGWLFGGLLIGLTLVLSLVAHALVEERVMNGYQQSKRKEL